MGCAMLVRGAAIEGEIFYDKKKIINLGYYPLQWKAELSYGIIFALIEWKFVKIIISFQYWDNDFAFVKNDLRIIYFCLIASEYMKQHDFIQTWSTESNIKSFWLLLEWKFVKLIITLFPTVKS